MRARELRDVIEVLIVPSLDLALEELNQKRGSRRRARMLVQQSVDQLRKMLEPTEAAVTDLHGHRFSSWDQEAGCNVCRCGAFEGGEAAKQGCGLPKSFD